MLMLHVVISRSRRAMRTAVLCTAVFLLLVGVLPAALGTGGVVHAAGQTCTVTNLSPHTADDGTETGFAFTITSDDQVAWIRVISPSSSLTIVGGSSDWLPTVTYTSSQATFTGSPIASGNPLSVQVDADVNYFPSSSWIVQTAIDSGGTDRVTCSGDTSITVNSSGPPSITSLSASALTTSANIIWTTDKASDSVVDYGYTSSYGQEKSNSAQVTSHNITLTGLTPGHEYHYQVTSTDSLGQSVSSSDGTFFTASGSSGGGGGGGGGSSGGGGTTVTGNTGHGSSSDKTAPSIHFTSSIAKISPKPPTVSGVASDNIAVKRVEYSTDGGKNWLRADHATGLGTTSVAFSFTPLNLEDDTYIFMARAIDPSGNTGTTKGVQVVIDRLPPAIGSSVITVGSHVIAPDSRGVITTLSGVGLTINLSTSGGASEVSIKALDVQHGNTTAASFTLTRDTDDGLWHGLLSFSQAGYYQLVAHGLDGAGNTITRSLMNVVVTRPALVLSEKGPVAHAIATVYYLDPDANDWVVWDGQAYGQTNPQPSDKNGSFAYLLPTGTYYVHVSANGYLPMNSRSFTVSQAMPLASVFQLQPSSGLHLLLWPFANLIAQTPMSNLGASALPEAFSRQPLVGKQLLAFSLADTNGATQNPVAWLGKPTIVTVMSTWTPTAAQQLAALDSVAANRDINVKLIGMQESTAKLQAFDSVAGINMPWIADPSGSLSAKLAVGGSPMHIFISRDGTIERVATGTLSAEQLTEILTGLL